MASRRKQRPTTWREYRVMQILLCCLLPVGPAFILHGLHDNERDRPSLQWPKVSGTIVQSTWSSHRGGRHNASTYYRANVAFTYRVNGQFFSGNRVNLWDPNMEREGSVAESFVTAHPVHSAVDVYYDPAHPEDAVLVPGADEFGNRLFIWGGGILCVLVPWSVFRSRSFFAQRIAAAKAAAAARAARPGSERIASLPHAYASYEPGDERKLNCFPDQDCLNEVLGHRGKKLQDWQPDDRMIDTAGREYRLIHRPEKDCYDLEPTGETWSYERLLDVAEADARLARKDPIALRRRVEEAPAEKKMAVLMQGIDDLSAVSSFGARLAMAGFILFLLLFFVAVMFGAAKVMMWLGLGR